MPLKVINKINEEFALQEDIFLTPGLRRMLCNGLTQQQHFDYACSVWYPNLNEKLKKN